MPAKKGIRDRLQPIMARVRGEQTLDRLKRAGLRADQIYIAGRTFIDPQFPWAITIGNKTIVAHDVRIVAHDAASRRLLGYTQVRPVTIGSNCYIGANSIVLPGTVIGDNSIIGAGSVVRGEIPPDVVAAGNPARVITPIPEYLARQREDLERGPRYEVRARELTDALRAELWERLQEEGRVFIR